VPHNLISTQDSPVPLLKFQMALRLKILKASRSKKGTQIYFSFLLKVLANEPLPGSPTRPLWRGRRIYRTFCVSQKPHLSGSAVKEPSLKVPFMESLAERCPTIRAFIHLSKSLAYKPPPHILRSSRMGRGRHGERRLHPETFLTYLAESPVKELRPRPPAQSIFRERCFIPRALFSSSQIPQ